MARRPRLFAPGLLYHVIIRGNQRRKTFIDDRDYRAYLERLARYRIKYNVSVYAYCLMPNHAHLLLESSDHPLAKFMQGVQQSYSQYFNLRHRKVGHVFQGRYKAIICEKDEYLLELVRYIHLNPVRAKMVTGPEQYRYSGHEVYTAGKPTEILDPRKVLSLFGGRGAYKRFVHDGLGEGHKDEYYEAEDQRFLGGEGFGEKIQEKTGEVRSAIKKRPMGTVIKELAEELEIGIEALRSRDRSWALSSVRTTIAYVLTRRLGYTLGEVANYLRRDIATIGTLVGRLWARMQSDSEFQRRVDRLVRIVES